MKPPIILLLAIGSVVQISGVVYAVTGFEDINMVLLVAALVVGSIIESAGVVLHVLSRSNK